MFLGKVMYANEFETKEHKIKLNHKIYTLQVHACAGGRVLGLIFAGYMPQASQSPYPITVEPRLSGLFLWSQFGHEY